MSRPARSDLVLLLVVTVVAAWAGMGHLTLEVDAENMSMKSGTSAAAAAEARRVAAFGDEPTILALFQPMAVNAWEPADQTELERWSAEIDGWPLVAKALRVPAELPAGVLMALVPEQQEGGRYAEATSALVERLRAEAPPTVRVAVTGQPVVETVLAQELRREQARVVPVLVAALLAFLVIVYRSPSPALGALLAPLAGVAVLGGVESLLAIRLDPVSSLLSPAVLTVGVAASIHVLERVRQHLRGGDSLVDATRLSQRELLRPFVLTATTTAAGFLGLLTSPIPAVRRFAWLASLGVVLTSSLALFVLPAFLRTFGCPPARSRPIDGRASTVAAAVMHRAARPTLVATLGFALVFGWSWTRVHVDTHPLELLPKDHLLRQETARVADAAGSIDCIDLFLPPPHPPLRMLKLAALTSRLAEVDGLAGPCGPPRTSEGDDVLVPVLLAPGGSRVRLDAAAEAVRVAEELGWRDVTASGLPLTVAEDSAMLVDAQLRGLGATLGLLWLVMAVGFRSPWLATVGLAPNVLPCLLVYGGLAFLGRPLSVASALIGTVMLGLIVDDTIHMLHAYGLQRRLGRGMVSAITRGLRTVARPITVTSSCLVVGFSTTLLGRLSTTREFGALAVVIVLAALAADLVVLPALLALGSTSERGAGRATSRRAEDLLGSTTS